MRPHNAGGVFLPREKPIVRRALVRLPCALPCRVNSFAYVGIEVQVPRHALVSPLACSADGCRRGKALCPESGLVRCQRHTIIDSTLLTHLYAPCGTAPLHRCRAAQLEQKGPLEIRSVDREIPR